MEGLFTNGEISLSLQETKPKKCITTVFREEAALNIAGGKWESRETFRIYFLEGNVTDLFTGHMTVSRCTMFMYHEDSS
jgi:hypothetical protein